MLLMTRKKVLKSKVHKLSALHKLSSSIDGNL